MKTRISFLSDFSSEKGSLREMLLKNPDFAHVKNTPTYSLSAVQAKWEDFIVLQ